MPNPFWLRLRGEQRDKEVFEKHIVGLGLKLDVYEKILSKQKYAAGNVCVFHNYIEQEHAFILSFFGLGYHTSRPLPCRCGGGWEVTCKNGKRRDGIGASAKCKEVRGAIREEC
jgi:hypothetical protein